MTDPKKALVALHENMSRVIFGKKDTLTLSLVTLLGRGHLLIEDVPGVGKTSLARSIAQSIKGGFKRLQCTPDLLPSDVTGVSVFDRRGAPSSSFRDRCSPTSSSPTRSIAPRRARKAACLNAWANSR
jgi:MoxR-like ATPase